MKFFTIHKNDVFTTNDGITLRALTKHSSDNLGSVVEFETEFLDCCNQNDYDPEDPEGKETGCDLDCDHCPFYHLTVGRDVLTPADLHSRGIGVNCKIVFSEDE